MRSLIGKSWSRKFWLFFFAFQNSHRGVFRISDSRIYSPIFFGSFFIWHSFFLDGKEG